MNTNGESNEAIEDPVVIVPYDSAWPQQFETERRRLSEVLKPWLAGEIEHIGSTAVPSLSAKPVIDILAPVESLQNSRPTIGELSKLNYCYFPYVTDRMHWFCKPFLYERTHHLHLVPKGSYLWEADIAFRNALREDSVLANEYSVLKTRLADQFRNDREAYTAAKGVFIESVLTKLGIPDKYAT